MNPAALEFLPAVARIGLTRRALPQSRVTGISSHVPSCTHHGVLSGSPQPILTAMARPPPGYSYTFLAFSICARMTSWVICCAHPRGQGCVLSLQCSSSWSSSSRAKTDAPQPRRHWTNRNLHLREWSLNHAGRVAQGPCRIDESGPLGSSGSPM